MTELDELPTKAAVRIERTIEAETALQIKHVNEVINGQVMIGHTPSSTHPHPRGRGWGSYHLTPVYQPHPPIPRPPGERIAQGHTWSLTCVVASRGAWVRIWCACVWRVHGV
eukprot:COSAG05_NODE_373_length_10684_cov_22.075012_5_plen_112_part_00